MFSLISYLKQMLIHESPSLYLQIHYSPIINSNILLCIRIIALLYLTAFYMYDLSQSQTPMDKLIYLTDTSFFFTWLYFLTVTQAKILGNLVKGLEYYVEILFQSMFCIQLFITIAYWTVIYPQDTQQNLFKNINWHGVPLLLLTLDQIFNSYRFIPKQYISILIFSSIYMFCINLPYSLTVRPVYGQASDWVHWLTYIFIVGEVIVTGIVFGICRVLYVKCKQEKIKQWVQRQGIRGKDGETERENQAEGKRKSGGTHPNLG